MFRKACSLVVDYVWFVGAVIGRLFTQNKTSNFVGSINPVFVPTQTSLINSLSPARFMNSSLVNFSFSNVSTGPIRAITKYLTIYYYKIGDQI